MSDNARKPVPSVEEIVGETVETSKDSLLDQVTLPRGEYELLVHIKERSERSVATKVKDAVKENRRRILLGAGTAVTLAAAAVVVVKNKDSILESAEKAVEAGSEAAEHGARDVKKTVRTARTGSPTK